MKVKLSLKRQMYQNQHLFWFEHIASTFGRVLKIGATTEATMIKISYTYFQSNIKKISLGKSSEI